MAIPPQDQVEETMVALKDYQGRLLAVRQELTKALVSVQSKDHALTITMTTQGEVKDVRFHGMEYAAMPTSQLSAVLVETLNQARTKAAGMVQEAFRPFMDFGSSLRESLSGGSGLDEILAPLKNLPSFLQPSADAEAAGMDADE